MNYKIISLTVVVLVFLYSAPVFGGLAAVSGTPDTAVDEVGPGGDPAQIAISLANGFPIWYRDFNGLKLELCLDPPAEVAPGVLLEPCLLEAPFFGAPPSFPNNFGPEAFYWSATIFGNYASSDSVNNSVLVVLAQEAAFLGGGAVADGSQTVSSRIRLRIDVPVAGTYRVTHPFGSRDYVVAIPGARAINQTQDLGGLVARDFLTSMADGPAPPAPLLPSIDSGAVNETGATIGPFLAASEVHGGVFDPALPGTFTGGPVTFNGATYIGLPFAPNLASPALPLDIFQPVTAGLNGVDYFELTLLDPPDGFLLDRSGIDGSPDNTVRFTNFQISGRIFDDGPNRAPEAVADVTATLPGTAVSIDVVNNDLDLVDAGNVHGINPQAMALVHPDTGALVLLLGPDGLQGVPTAAGGRVRRITETLTGRTTYLYTPPPDFTGVDTFEYVVQDKGGIVSLPASVTVTVEDLRIDKAVLRPRFGRWIVSGTSTDAPGNVVRLTAGPLAAMSGAGVVPPVLTEARAEAGLRVKADRIDFALKIDPLPASAVTRARIHVGTPNESGPFIFTLYDRQADGDFTDIHSGALGINDLSLRPERGISSFAEAVRIVLSGNAYINITTEGNPNGEIRGPLSSPLIGTAAVQPENGVWQFQGKAKTSPGMLPSINAESANGVMAPGTPLLSR